MRERARDIISRHLQELELSTISDVQAAVTESVELDVPRGMFVFEEVRRTVRYKAVARGRAGGSMVGGLVGAGIGFFLGGLLGTGIGASVGAGIGGGAGGEFAGEREVEQVVGADYNEAAARIADGLGEEAKRQIDQCVKDLRKRCLLPIRRQASIVEKRLRQFEESLRGIQRSLESNS